MSNKNVTYSYLREFHSIFEGISFINIFLISLMSSFIAGMAKPIVSMVAPEYQAFIFPGLTIVVGLVYLLIAAFTRIQSLAIEFALGAWIAYIVAIYKIVNAFHSPSIELLGNAAQALSIGLIATTGVYALIFVLAIALRKNKFKGDDSVTHTRRYKIYRFFRGFAFVLMAFVLIVHLNNKIIIPKLLTIQSHVEEIYSNKATAVEKTGEEFLAYLKEHYKDFKYFVRNVAIIFGIEGILLILLGFFSSIFSLGIELIVIGWGIIMLYTILFPGLMGLLRYFFKYEIVTITGINAEIYSNYMISGLIAAVFIASLFSLGVLLRLYIKRSNAHLK